MPDSKMQSLYSQLHSLGVSTFFARKAFPSWWEDSIASTDSGLQQAQIYLSKAFNLDIRSFDEKRIEFRQTQRKFKLSRNVSEKEVSLSAHYATGIARVVLFSIENQTPVPQEPLELRSECLTNGDSVNLTTLLQWCSAANIPVMHVDDLPGKKMTGLVVRESGKYAIILSRKGCQSEMLFWLAHELGHIACGHLNQDGFFADEKIGNNAEDDDEKQADKYGVLLLNGAEKKYTVKSLMPAKQLAVAATSMGESSQVDPGHILLNFGHHSNQFKLAKAALNELHQTSEAAIKEVNGTFFNWFTEGPISEDQLEIIQKACSYQPNLAAPKELTK
ncbi:hypothetical protein B9Z44_07090 [Limnohabitans curvus]|uniref:IrrE N-terminal-like domain-containing protein n=1 Tax=Limnohabitans curvus TaxID=323423 RepID=A0A315ENK3_9BURK|nr:hypothetical protein [Limnohabitans curvus]PUE59353.1 hypothetical protein B9Z44_07090 [Limnohabitans curvus]